MVLIFSRSECVSRTTWWRSAGSCIVTGFPWSLKNQGDILLRYTEWSSKSTLVYLQFIALLLYHKNDHSWRGYQQDYFQHHQHKGGGEGRAAKSIAMILTSITLLSSILPHGMCFLYINSSGSRQSVTDQTVIRYELQPCAIWQNSEKRDDGCFN